jgi:multiple sugar transport system substrate-binding protein
MRTRKWMLVPAVVTLFAGLLAGCSGSGSNGGKTELTVAYGSTYVFDSEDLATKYWNSIKEQFDASHKDATLKLVPIPGSYNDIVSKLSLDYRSPSTAPDVAQLPTGQLGDWQSSGYLAQLDDQLNSSDFWKTFPKPVQQETQFDGKTYAVSMGDNVSSLFYNKQMFAKAGLPVPWNPRNWADIVDASKRIKAAVPGVTPLWLAAGTSQGTNGILQGGGNLINGSDTPTIYDAASKKWVIDSPGLRQTLDLYKQIYSQGLGAAQSDLFSPSAVTVPLTLFQQGKLAIAVGSNYYFGNWSKFVAAPEWPQAADVMDVAKIPTANGQAPGGASTLGGWAIGVYSGSKHADLSWDLVKLMENEQNLVNAANWAGFVPPNSQYVKSPDYVNFVPHQEFFGDILNIATPTPSMADYSAWGQGFEEATGKLVSDPTTTVDQAIAQLKDTATKSLGEDKVKTLP